MNRYSKADRSIDRYMQKKAAGGRSGFARAVDYVALRLLLFIAAYLLYLPRFSNRATVFLLSAITLGIAMLVLHLIHAVRYERFCEKEWERVRKQLLCDMLMLMPMQRAIPLVSALCPQNATPVVLQRALPVDANALLAIVRTHANCGELHVFSCTEYDETAKAFAARTNGMLTLHSSAVLHVAAAEAGVQPDDEAVYNAIRSQIAYGRNRGRGVGFQLLAVGARKYFYIAMLLFALSFFVDYALYYRLLSGACMSAAALSVLRRRNA